MTQEPLSASLAEYPEPVRQWRIVAHMLPVSASQNCPPLPLVVLVKVDNLLPHDTRVREVSHPGAGSSGQLAAPRQDLNKARSDTGYKPNLHPGGD
jgi:hypothetical protein